MAGLSEGSPAILCRYRITANTPPLQGGDAGSTPATCSTRRSHRTHDVKLGEHGPLVVRCPNVDETASKIEEHKNHSSAPGTRRDSVRRLPVCVTLFGGLDPPSWRDSLAG